MGNAQCTCLGKRDVFLTSFPVDVSAQVCCLQRAQTMARSVLQQATRVLVKVLLSLARAYELAITVNRDATENEILQAYKKGRQEGPPRQRRQARTFPKLAVRERRLGQGPPERQAKRQKVVRCRVCGRAGRCRTASGNRLQDPRPISIAHVSRLPGSRRLEAFLAFSSEFSCGLGRPTLVRNFGEEYEGEVARSLGTAI